MIPKDLIGHLTRNKIKFWQVENFNTGVEDADIIYQTRIQKERFKSQKEYKKYFGKYILNKNTIKFIRSSAKIMHPLPRVNEITPDVDSDPRALYFEEAQNGLYVRMALLLFLFDKVKF